MESDHAVLWFGPGIEIKLDSSKARLVQEGPMKDPYQLRAGQNKETFLQRYFDQYTRLEESKKHSCSID